MISLEDFDKIDLGDFGAKRSSAQITDLYEPEDLIGKQVLVVANFEPIRIADIKSEVRILGVKTTSGNVVLSPIEKIQNGLIVS